jgi:hypothetical protein
MNLVMYIGSNDRWLLNVIMDDLELIILGLCQHLPGGSFTEGWNSSCV